MSQVKTLLKYAAVFIFALIVLSGILLYLNYRELRLLLAERLSVKATSIAGQEVKIMDVTLGPSSIALHGVCIRNPEGYGEGDLLCIEKVSMDPVLTDLLTQQLNFRKIDIHSPRLTIVRNNEGRMNVSDELMRLFSKKETTYRYSIDEIKISSGSFRLNDEAMFNNQDIDVLLKNVASAAGTRTIILGASSWLGGRLDLDGWIFLKDEAKKMDVSLSGEGIRLFHIDPLDRLGIDRAASGDASVNVRGDMEKGYFLRVDSQVKKARASFFRRNMPEITLSGRAALLPPFTKLTLEAVSMTAGGFAAVAAGGELSRTGEAITYDVRLNVRNLDLSAFSLMHNVSLAGHVSSGPVTVKGKVNAFPSEMKGVFELRKISVKSPLDQVSEGNITMSLKEGSGELMRITGRAKLSALRGFRFRAPSEGNVSAVIYGKPGSFSGKFTTVIQNVNAEKGKREKVEARRIEVRGEVQQGRELSGQLALDARDAVVSEHPVGTIGLTSSFRYGRGVIRAENVTVKGTDFSLSAGRIGAMLPRAGKNDGFSAEVKDLGFQGTLKGERVSLNALSLLASGSSNFETGNARFSAGGINVRGLDLKAIEGSGMFDKRAFAVEVKKANVGGGVAAVSVSGKSQGGFPLAVRARLSSVDIARSMKTFSEETLPYVARGTIEAANFEGIVVSRESIEGKAEFTGEKIGIHDEARGRDLLNDLHVQGRVTFEGSDLEMITETRAGKLVLHASGRVKDFAQPGRVITARAQLQEVDLGDIREAFWDIFPDSLLYAGFDGAVSTDISLDHTKDRTRAKGAFRISEVVITGENGQYKVGPVDGVIPVDYEKGGRMNLTGDLTTFEPSRFREAFSRYSSLVPRSDYGRVTIGTVNYGFDLLKEIDIEAGIRGDSFSVRNFSANIFGGSLRGIAAVHFSKRLEYEAGLVLRGLSLAKLCDEVGTIRGYLSGNVDGIGILKGAGSGIGDLKGKADFWSYSSKSEKTKISREFLKKVGGSSVKMYLRDRPFDKGIMSLYLQEGFVVFRELELSNKNIFGITDLSVKVAPFNNRIALDHLLWSLTEAAQRAEEKEK
jgi:hypothetical protein